MQKGTTLGSTMLVAAGHATDWRKGLAGKGEAANWVGFWWVAGLLLGLVLLG